MKNNKAMTYLLLALVVSIWGYVLYTIVAKVGAGDLPLAQQAPSRTSDENLAYYHWQDSLRYDTVYNTPFPTGKLPIEEEETIAQQPQPAAGYDPMAYAPAMDVQYLGFIENEGQRQRIALVQINGKQYYMRQQQSIDGVTLLRLEAASIRIKTSHETLSIAKK